MSLFDIIGFVAVLAVGGYLAFAGFQFARFSAGFGGKVEAVAFAYIGLVGVAIIVAAFWFSPLKVVSQQTDPRPLKQEQGHG